MEEQVKKLVAAGRRIEARQLVQKTLKIKKRAAQERVKKIVAAELPSGNETAEGLEFTDRYVYNPENGGRYVFFCKKAGKNIVLEKSIVQSMLNNYSELVGEGDSLNELARRFSIPKIVVTEVLNILGVTHDEMPVLKEDLIEKDESDIVNDLLTTKKFSVYEKFQKESWKETEAKARRWDDFNCGQLNPFKDFVSNFKSEKYSKPVKAAESQGQKHLVVGVSDWHFGANSDGEALFHGKDWNIEETQKAAYDYAAQIDQFVDSSKGDFSSCTIVVTGDMIHTLTGFTEKGTKIEGHPLGEKQFEIAFKTLDLFIEELARLFPKVQIYATGGNHSYGGDYALYFALKSYYAKNTNISFEIEKARWMTFRIADTFFIAEHGASPFYKSKVPKADKARGDYIQSLLLAKADLLAGTNQRVFLTSDLHSFENKEYNGFEFIRFSTLVAGDKYSDQLNLKSRPRQNALVVDGDGVKEIVNFYL